MQAQTDKDAVTRIAIRGFTLVELLVVISIIALLIAILLPSLSKARDQAKTVVCSTRIKGLLSAMSVYAAENGDYIAGSPDTSGSVLFGPQTSDEAGMKDRWSWNPCQVWDWGGGLAQSMSMKFSTKPQTQRFIEVVRAKAFTCPSNKVIATGHTQDLGEDLGPLRMVSYNTSRNFMWPGKASLMSGQFSDDYWTKAAVGSWWAWRDRPGGVSVPDRKGWAEASNPSYIPRIDQVGTPASKVFIADGARYAIENKEPTYNTYPWAGYGGAFSDVGPYSFFSRAWDRRCAWAEYQAQDFKDMRIFSFRHGMKTPYLPLGSYKMNVGFFDTHVETMNDIKSANPHMWLPRGFFLYPEKDDLHPDVMETYMQTLDTDQMGQKCLKIR